MKEYIENMNEKIRELEENEATLKFEITYKNSQIS